MSATPGRNGTPMNATETSIFEQFGYWRQVTGIAPAGESGRLTVVLGCGSSFHLSQTIAASFCRQGRRAIAVPAGEWTRRRGTYVVDDEPVSVLALSRSGTTTETLQALEISRAAGHDVTALVCDADSPMARLPGAVVMATHPAEGIVMTVSASLMLLAGLRLAGIGVDAETVAAAERLLGEAGPHLPDLVQRRSHVVFIGGGALHGIAQEGAIKLQEMSLSYAQAYHPLEYRHGPISLVDERTLVVAMFEDDARPEELRIVADIQQKGGHVLGLGGPGDVSLRPGAASAARGLVFLPVIQALGERMAQSKGLDTAAPRHLQKVVILD